jgi:hypothetical protein
MPRGQLIQIRSGTAAAWSSANPILAAGEPGLESDTGKEKRGDGATAWTSLAYTTDTSRLPATVASTAQVTAAIATAEGASDAAGVAAADVAALAATKGTANGLAGLDSNSDLTLGQVPLGIRGLVSSLVSYGNSYTNGGATDPDHGYLSIMAAAYGIDEQDNYGIGGSYLGWDSSNGSNGGVSLLAQRERRHVTQQPYVAGRDLVILDFGYEDVMLGTPTGTDMTSPVVSPAAQNVSIFINSLRTALSRIRASSIKYAGDKTTNLDASIVLATPANWTAVSAPTPVGLSRVPAAIGSHPVGYVGTATNGAGGAFSITIPGDYPGSVVCPLSIVFIVGQPLGTTAGTITASGASTGTLDLVQAISGGTPANTPGTFDNVNAKYNMVTMRFAAASAGAKYIAPSGGTPQTLTFTPTGLVSYGVGLDSWHIEAQYPPDIIVPAIENFGNPGILVFQSTRNSDCAAFTTAIRSLITNEFNDGTVLCPDAALNGSGNILGLNGTAGNSAAATVVSSTGFGATTATNCQVTSTASPAVNGTPAVLAVGTELVYFTGVTGSAPTWTLTGVVRGYFGTAAVAHAGNPICDLANIAAIPNYSYDLTHPSNLGQQIRAAAFLNAHQQASLTTPKRQRTANARAKIFGQYGFSGGHQIIPASVNSLGEVVQAIYWDQTLDDTVSMHDPTAGPGSFPLAGTYTQFIIPADGIYDIASNLQWGYSRSVSTGGAAAGGTIGMLVRLTPKIPFVAVANQNPYLGWDTRSVGADLVDAVENAFYVLFTSLVVPRTELRQGDILQVLAWQANNTPSGQATGAAPTTITANMTSSQTTATVASSTGIVANDYVRADDEQMLVTSVTNSTTLAVTRAQQGTTAITHTSTAPLFNGREVQGNYAAPTPSRLTIQRVGRL